MRRESEAQKIKKIDNYGLRVSSQKRHTSSLKWRWAHEVHDSKRRQSAFDLKVDKQSKCLVQHAIFRAHSPYLNKRDSQRRTRQCDRRQGFCIVGREKCL